MRPPRTLRHLLPALLTLAAAAPTSGTQAPAAAAPATQPAATPSHRAAVRRFLEVTRARETNEQTVERMIEAMARQAQGQAPAFVTLMRDFWREQMAWATIEPELTQVYVAIFTEPELRQLIAMYETPAGRLLVARTPDVMSKTQEVTTQRMQAAMPKLMERMQTAAMGQSSAPRDTSSRQRR